MSESVYYGPVGRVAYGARRASKWLLIVNGTESVAGGPVGHITFSPDGKRMAFVVIEGNTWRFMVDGSELGRYDKTQRTHSGWHSTQGFVFSPDSKHVAFCGWRKGQDFAVLDGAEGAPWDYIEHPTFSPDSRHFAYTGLSAYREKGSKSPRITWKCTLVVDGKALGEQYGGSSGPLFAEDGRLVAYRAAQGGKGFFVVDGVAGRRFAAIEQSTLSPDGKHVVCFTRDGSYPTHKQHITVDGVRTRGYDNSACRSQFVFDSPTLFHTIATRGGKAFLVNVRIVPAD